MDNQKDIEIFSAEERSEINRRIESASARDAVAAPGLPSKKEAAKRGVFPLWVNIFAVVILAAGIFLLFTFQQTDAAEIRTSGLGTSGQALIRAIISETNSQLNEKNDAIYAMNRRIAEVDSELERLDSLETLTDEQRKTLEELKARQEEYRESLASLQQEKTQLLLQARIREEEVRQQEKRLAEQLGFLEDISGQDRAAMELAREEFSKLSGEAQKTPGFSFTAIQAEEPATVPPGEGAEEALRQQVASQSAMIAEQNAALAELQETITEKDRQLESLKAQNTSQAQQIESLQKTISSISTALQDNQ